MTFQPESGYRPVVSWALSGFKGHPEPNPNPRQTDKQSYEMRLLDEYSAGALELKHLGVDHKVGKCPVVREMDKVPRSFGQEY